MRNMIDRHPLLPHRTLRPSMRKFPSERGRRRSAARLSVVVVVVRVLVFDNGSVALLGAVDGVERGLAGGLEVFEGLLEEGGGVLVRAAAFHVGGDVAPEAGGVRVFEFFFGGEEVLVLVGGWR